MAMHYLICIDLIVFSKQQLFGVLVRSQRPLRNRIVTGHLVIDQLVKTELELA
jgi:hypothetical protein